MKLQAGGHKSAVSIEVVHFQQSIRESFDIVCVEGDNVTTY